MPSNIVQSVLHVDWKLQWSERGPRELEAYLRWRWQIAMNLNHMSQPAGKRTLTQCLERSLEEYKPEISSNSTRDELVLDSIRWRRWHRCSQDRQPPTRGISATYSCVENREISEWPCTVCYLRTSRTYPTPVYRPLTLVRFGGRLVDHRYTRKLYRRVLAATRVRL